MPEIIINRDVIIANIRDGYHDDDLDRFTQTIKTRREYLATAKRWEFQPGDTVRFNSQINPKYLVGKTAVVSKVNRKTASVRCPDNYRDYHRFSDTIVRCPLELIEAVE